jgi:hypothetical protein
MGLIGDVMTGLGSRNAAKKGASDQVNAEVEAGKLIGQAGGNAQDQVATNYNQARDTYNPYVAGGAGAINGMSVGALGGWAANPYQAALPAVNAGANPYATSTNPYATFYTSASHTNSPYAVTQNPYATTNANTQFHYDANSLQNDPSYQFQRDEGLKAMQQTLNAQGVTGGAAAQASGQYASNLAATQYAADYARQQGTFNSNLQNQLSQNQQNFTNSNLNNQQNFTNTLNQNQSNFNNLYQQNQANFTNTNLNNQQNFTNTNSINQLGYNQAANNYQLGENTFNTNANTYWSRLQNLAQLGLTGTTNAANLQAQEGLNLANIGTDTAAKQANTTEGVGNAFASGAVGSANAMSAANQQFNSDMMKAMMMAAA